VSEEGGFNLGTSSQCSGPGAIGRHVSEEGGFNLGTPGQGIGPGAIGVGPPDCSRQNGE
jgi:hypothetical protein